MPRTKLDKYSAKKPTKAEIDAVRVRKAFAKVEIFTQRDMAKAIGADESSISRWLTTGFTPTAIARIHAVVNFSPEELEALLCK